MRTIRLLAFAAPLALLLPLSAQADNWPAGAKKDYMKDCVAAASQSVDAKRPNSIAHAVRTSCPRSSQAPKSHS